MLDIFLNAGSNGVVRSLLLAIGFLLAVMIGITAHELAHGYTAYKCGDMTAKYSGRLSINPAKHFDPIGFFMLIIVGFGWAKPVPINPNNFTKPYKSSMVKVSLAGIVINLILAFLIYPAALGMLFAKTPNQAVYYIVYFFYHFFTYTVLLNISLAVFNILPVYPLDGFNFLETVTKPYNKAVEFLRRYGYFILLGLLVLSNLPVFGAFSPFYYLQKWVSTPITWFWEMIFRACGAPV